MLFWKRLVPLLRSTAANRRAVREFARTVAFLRPAQLAALVVSLSGVLVAMGVAAAPPAPQIKTPASSAVFEYRPDESFLFSWEDYPGALGYNIRLYGRFDTDAEGRRRARALVSENGFQGTSFYWRTNDFSPERDLERYAYEGKVYYRGEFRLQARVGPVSGSEWKRQTFFVLIDEPARPQLVDAPSLLRPGRDVVLPNRERGDVTWRFDWVDVPGATGYEFLLANANVRTYRTVLQPGQSQAEVNYSQWGRYGIPWNAL